MPRSAPCPAPVAFHRRGSRPRRPAPAHAPPFASRRRRKERPCRQAGGAVPEENVMTLSTFFFVCFLVGFTLSLLSFLFGALHLHLPHHAGHGVFHHGASHAPTLARGGAAAGHVAAPAAGKSLAARDEGGASPVNFMTVCAFL